MLCGKQRHLNHNPGFQNFLVRGRRDASSMGTDHGAQGKVKKVLEQRYHWPGTLRGPR